MARLNEPAAPPESLELLRKRFLRQNKEIIKINADQAARIRTIEAETTRLLSENITLREENIRLNHQVNKGRHALALENVGVVKDKLQIFASGLNDLLAELSQAQSTLPDPRPYHDTPKRRSPKSPSQQWKGGLSIAELAEQEGRLPPIVEGKYYPRKTFDAEEIGLLVRASPVRHSPMARPSPSLADSPDLGPPPVIHFDIGDPTKNGQSPPSPSPVKPRAAPSKKMEPDGESSAISSVLETRKKRRTGTFAGDSEVRTVSELEKVGKHRGSPEAEDEDGHALVKAGGKRKYSMREDDEPTQPPKTAPSTDQPSKETESSLELPIRNSRPTKTYADDGANAGKDASHTEKGSAVTAHVKRRALGEKPVNTDPVISPTKIQARKQKDGKGDATKGASVPSEGVGKGDGQSTHSHSEANTQPASGGSKPFGARHGRKNARVEQVPFLEPMTPAPVVDIAPPEAPSAPSTEPEKKSQDTPPPSDLGSRPSRRSRPTISYAEPNLRDKMRRPTKDLIDAVTTVDGKGSRLSSVGELQASNATDTAAVDADKLPKWQTGGNEPTSPLATRSEGLNDVPVLPSTISMERKRRSFVTSKKSVQDLRNEEPEQSSSSPSSPSSPEYTRGGKGGRRTQLGKDTVNIQSVIQDAYRARAAQHAAERDVFDVGSSSPESSKGVSIRVSRRVTSVPENLNNKANSRRGGNNKRRETMANNTGGSMTVRGKEGGEMESAGHSETETLSREGRMATRRRSMML